MATDEILNALMELESINTDNRFDYRIAYNNLLYLIKSNNKLDNIILDENLVPYVDMLGINFILNNDIELFRQLYKMLENDDIRESDLENAIYDVISLNQYRKLPELWNLNTVIDVGRLDLADFLIKNTDAEVLKKNIREAVKHENEIVLKFLLDSDVYNKEPEYFSNLLISLPTINYVKKLIRQLGNNQTNSQYIDIINLITYDGNNLYENIGDIFSMNQLNILVKNFIINDNMDLVIKMYSLFFKENLDEIVYTNITIPQYEKLSQHQYDTIFKAAKYHRTDIINNQLSFLDSSVIERIRDIANENEYYDIIEVLDKYRTITPMNDTNTINPEYIDKINSIMNEIDEIYLDYNSAFINIYTNLMNLITYYNGDEILISDDIINIMEDNELRYLNWLFMEINNIDFFNQMYKIISEKPDIDLENFIESIYEEISLEQYKQLSIEWHSLIEAVTYDRADLVEYLLEGDDAELDEAIELAQGDILTILQNYNLHFYITTIPEIKKAIENNYNLHDNDDEFVNDIAERGDVKTLKYLKELGLDLHRNNDSALLSAISTSNLDNVKYLVSEGVISQLDDALLLSKGKVKKYLESIKHKEELSLSQQKDLASASGLPAPALAKTMSRVPRSAFTAA